jgi:hypothetical protein
VFIVDRLVKFFFGTNRTIEKAVPLNMIALNASEFEATGSKNAPLRRFIIQTCCQRCGKITQVVEQMPATLFEKPLNGKSKAFSILVLLCSNQ